MTTQQGYVFDTDAILNLTRRIYPSAVFPGVHEQIDDLVSNNLVISSVEVLGELGINTEKKVTEWLNTTQANYPPEYNLPIKWAQKHQGIFLEFDSGLEDIVSKIVTQHKNVVKTQSTSGYDADVHLIALAIHNQWVMVTHEKPSNNQDRPKIPDICSNFGVQCVDLLEMFRIKGWLF